MLPPLSFRPCVRASRAFTLCLSLAALLALAALLPSPARAAAAPPGLVPPLPTSVPSEADCAAFGRELADLLQNGKSGDAIRLLDQDALIARTLAGLDLPVGVARGFSGGLKASLPASLQQQFSGFATAHFLRVQNVGDDRRALVRLLSNDSAASYVAFVCVRRGTAPLQWSDAFTYTTGETISQSARRTALPLIIEANKSVVQKWTSTESGLAAHFETITQANRLLQSGKIVDAWALCEKLPPDVQKDRTVLILRLRLAQAIDEAKYLRVIGEWQATFPNDATLDFISVDGDILRKDYAAALAHAESFAKRIGGDPYLDLLAANILSMSQRYDEARVRARAALAADATLTDAFDTLLMISLKTHNFAETVTLLEQVRAAHPSVDFNNIATDPDYAEFRLSRAYLDWTAKKKASAPITVPAH